MNEAQGRNRRIASAIKIKSGRVTASLSPPEMMQREASVKEMDEKDGYCKG
ncbi:hypothetical protein TNCT_54971, partial [Trichonephila clavata]